MLLVVCLGCKASAFRAPGSFVAERHAAAALPRRHAAARRPPPRPLLACSPAAGSGREREAPGAARDAGGETVQSRRRVLRSGLSLAAAICDKANPNADAVSCPPALPGRTYDLRMLSSNCLKLA